MIKLPVTVIVPVKNEEINLPHCLECLKDFDQVLVVDSSSTDQTPFIAKKYGAEYHNFQWNGQFPKKRNWALQNLHIINNWVLFLDADEYISRDFIEELAKKITIPEINGYWLTYQNHFMGKNMKFGDTMKKLPLFRVGTGEYERIEEDSWSHLDMEIHEHPIITGRIGKIKKPVTHQDYKGLEHYVDRHNAYSSWEAKRYFQLKQNRYKGFTFRQKLKYSLLETGLLPIVYFVGSYIFKFGFLDGLEGYYFSRYKANYFFQIQTKIVELKKH